jgi:ribosome assembly protein YihI (activator of Der GTPase)
MNKNPKDPKIQRKKKIDIMMLDQMKKTRTKRKSPSPTLGGTIDHFEKIF